MTMTNIKGEPGTRYEMTGEEYKRFCMTPAELAKFHKVKLTGYTYNYERSIYEGEPAALDEFAQDLRNQGKRVEKYSPRVLWV